MAGIDNTVRDQLMTQFRWAVAEKLNFVPFPHQCEWWLASDGLMLTDQLSVPGEGVKVRLPGHEPKTFREEWRKTLPRLQGRARVVADLGSFKIGKSHSAAIWACGFAAVPNARVKLVGIEYDTCAPEFEYLIEALCSDRGMGIPPESLQNRPRDGRMWLDLPNGARFEARSWERKDGLKGKEDDAYVFCEAYQLPGIEAYTDFKQNLTARNGFAVFPTTPDRPWVEVFHQHGHCDPDFPDWQCVCGVARDVNPLTFDKDQKERDRKLMTKEKFGIHYEGAIGRYVGSVFNYQRGQRLFTPRSHPRLWKDPDGPATPANLSIPPHWECVGAADSGTFTSGVIATFDEVGNCYVFFEQPNYRYVGGKHEFEDSLTIPTWALTIAAVMDKTGLHGLFADRNSQFKREFLNYGVHLYPASAGLEQRTGIAREYFQGGAIFLAPWLDVLPYELEQAQWPEETTAGGRFGRLKKQDHTLDCLEHILARRPRSTAHVQKDDRLWVEQFTGRSMRRRGAVDAHLGVQ